MYRDATPFRDSIYVLYFFIKFKYVFFSYLCEYTLHRQVELCSAFAKIVRFGSILYKRQFEFGSNFQWQSSSSVRVRQNHRFLSSSSVRFGSIPISSTFILLILNVVSTAIKSFTASDNELECTNDNDFIK